MPILFQTRQVTICYHQSLLPGATKVIKIPSAALLHTAILLAILSHEVVTKILHVSGYDMWIHCASSLSFR